MQVKVLLISQVHAKSLPKRNTNIDTIRWEKDPLATIKEIQSRVHRQMVPTQSRACAENEKVKILWDFMIQTDRVIEHRRPDIVVVEKIGGKCFIIDIAVPGDHNIQQKEIEKKTKYEDLRIEVARLWNKEVSVIPVVVGALGTLTANLKKNLKELGIPNVIPCLQKSALLGTASILRRTLGISGSG